MQLSSHLGSMIHNTMKWPVDIQNPQHIIYVDVHPHESYVFVKDTLA